MAVIGINHDGAAVCSRCKRGLVEGPAGVEDHRLLCLRCVNASSPEVAVLLQVVAYVGRYGPLLHERMEEVELGDRCFGALVRRLDELAESRWSRWFDRQVPLPFLESLGLEEPREVDR